ncbi:hypothetical protein ACFVZD_41470 [Streptomyces sp. NPDC058287]|uniref:hypothetical protein n=1 Tax=unclassified Streptomyces TaxID=2593676 RepID=UPI0036EAB99A
MDLSRFARTALVAFRVLPVVLVVALSAPTWLVWPFLSGDKRQDVLTMVGRLSDWTNGHESAAKRTPLKK